MAISYSQFLHLICFRDLYTPRRYVSVHFALKLVLLSNSLPHGHIDPVVLHALGNAFTLYNFVLILSDAA